MKQIWKAFEAVIFGLFGAFPSFVLGGFVSAVGRHRDLEAQLKGEWFYKLILDWQGGVMALTYGLVWVIILTAFVGLLTASIKYGYNEVDGTQPIRNFLRRVLIPGLLSTSAFGAGILCRNHIKDSPGIAVLGIMVLLFSVIHYFLNYTEVLSSPSNDRENMI